MSLLRFLIVYVLMLGFASLTVGQEASPPNTQKMEIPFTPPEKALSSLEMPDGFKATLFAHEPDVHQPIAMTTDSRGRLWVVECLTYAERKVNYDLNLHDRVIILEDVDQDGVFDKRTVFWDKGQKLTGIELGFGGVWLTAAPNLLFIPDADADDRPDGPPQVLLNGFNGDEIRHNIVNGLRWGPDGWLYGRHGIQATSLVGKPDAAPSQRTPINCCIWRIHPQTKEFQVVAEGGTNSWGFDFDDDGEMFMINTVIGHMFHVVPGARFRRMYGAHFNPHTYHVIEQTADHYHWDRSETWGSTKKKGVSASTDAAGGGHAHTGLMCYLGDNWPDRYRNKWFTANFHGRRLNVERAERDGCGYTARHEPDMVKSSDPWFRGIEMLYGHDGGVFLLDWSDIGECHDHDGIHRTSGRIFKITYGDHKKPVDFDLTKWSDEQLVDCNAMNNQWYVRHARRILQQRHTAGEDMSAIKERLDSFIAKQTQQQSDSASPFDWRPTLRAFWALHSVGGADESRLLKLAKNPNEHLRAWAIRLLADGSEMSKEAKSHLTEMAAGDNSGLVRLYIASALNHFDLETGFEIYNALVQHESDKSDRTQPPLIWQRMEPHVMSNVDKAIELIGTSKLPTVRENIARRITAEIDEQPDATARLVKLLNGGDSNIVADVVRGMKLSLEGRTKVTKPAGWGVAFEAAMIAESDSNSISADMKKLNVIFGDGQGIAELRKIAKNKEAAIEARRQAIGEYAATRPEKLFGFLRPLVLDKATSNAAIKSLVFIDDMAPVNLILNRFGHLDPQGKTIAVNALTSRKEWSGELLKAVEKKRIPKNAIQARHARQIADYEDSELTEKLTQVWGAVRKSDSARLDEMERVRKLCLENNDLATTKSLARYQVGKKLFVEKCASCHVIHGAGKNVGPDLTGGDRKNMNYLLENIIDPNASVADSYRATKFDLADGRFVVGVVLQKTTQVTRIQTATEVVSIENKEIENSRPTALSLMPEGLLQNMAEDEIRALFHFLSSDRKR